jgi:hypothetical protein
MKNLWVKFERKSLSNSLLRPVHFLNKSSKSERQGYKDEKPAGFFAIVFAAAACKFEESTLQSICGKYGV